MITAVYSDHQPCYTFFFQTCEQQLLLTLHFWSDCGDVFKHDVFITKTEKKALKDVNLGRLQMGYVL